MADNTSLLIAVILSAVIIGVWLIVFAIAIHQRYPLLRDDVEIGKAGAILIATLVILALLISILLAGGFD